MLVTVTGKCSLLLMVTVKLKWSSLLMVTVTRVFNAPYGHCHSDPYCRYSVVMHVPSLRTNSRQSDAAASHSCHFTTVLYPKSHSEFQLPLNRRCRDIKGASSLFQNNCLIFAVTALSTLAPLQTCQHIYNAI